jgi:serine/threonine protein kinase
MPDNSVELIASTASLLDGNYVLGSVMGRGAMGIVYSATQVALDRRVAIKIPNADNAFVTRRFKTEARAAGRLSHRNIVRVIDFGGRDGAPFLVMEYVGGVPLETLVTEQGAMTTPVATEVVTQILAALEAAHTAGIIHADIKSGNVLVEVLADGCLLARVIDFGLAVFSDEPFVNDDQLLSGTPDYLAPELVNGGKPTVASDIYAAGVVLYELLTGTTPFGGGSSSQILARHLDEVVIPPSLRSEHSIPAAVETVVMRALAKDPGARFASASEFSADLRAAIPAGQLASARLASGTFNPPFSSETPTSNWHRDGAISPQPTASVATVGKNLEVALVRFALADAIESGNGDSIVASYLELVRLLVDDHGLAAAASELEHGLALLKRRNASLPAIWRLQLCLAGLYSGLGDAASARTAARIGYDLAVAASSELGQHRASELLARLARHRSVAKPRGDRRGMTKLHG